MTVGLAMRQVQAKLSKSSAAAQAMPMRRAGRQSAQIACRGTSRRRCGPTGPAHPSRSAGCSVGRCLPCETSDAQSSASCCPTAAICTSSSNSTSQGDRPPRGLILPRQRPDHVQRVTPGYPDAGTPPAGRPRCRCPWSPAAGASALRLAPRPEAAPGLLLPPSAPARPRARGGPVPRRPG